MKRGVVVTPEQGREMIERTERASGRAPVVIDPVNCTDTAAKRIEDLATGKRLKQDTKPLLNKLESQWFVILNTQFPNFPRPRPQAKRYRLANGAWYKPDMTATSWPQDNGPDIETAWEVKGPKQMKNMDRAMLVLKFAASAWPEVRFILVWKDNGIWKQQRALS